MDGQTSLPVSADVKVLTRIADTVHAEVPVRCIPVFQSLPTVKSIEFLTIVERLKMFIRDNIRHYAIDTTGEETTIGVYIKVNGDFSELDSAGVNTYVRSGNLISTMIPVRKMAEISSLPSVLHIAPSGYVHLNTQSGTAQGPGTGSMYGIPEDTLPARADSSEFDIDAYVEFMYDRFAIDTTGPEPTIGVFIDTDGTFDQLDSLGIRNYVVHRNGLVTATIPVRMIPQISRLESVEHLVLSQRVYPHSAASSSISMRPRVVTSPGAILGVVAEGIAEYPATLTTILLRTSQMDTDSVPVAPTPVFAQTVVTDSLGRFAFDSLSPGYYTCWISFASRLDPARNDTSTSPMPNRLPDVIIEQIRVQPQKASIIRIDQTSDVRTDSSDSEPSRAVTPVKWKEAYKPYDHKERGQ